MESQVVHSLDAPSDATVTPLETVAESLPQRLNTDPDNIENGLALPGKDAANEYNDFAFALPANAKPG